MRVLAGVLTAISAIGLLGCAAPTHYFGIDLTQPVPRQSRAIDEQLLETLMAAARKDCGSAARRDTPGCAGLREQFASRATAGSAMCGSDLSEMPLVLLARLAQSDNNPAQLELAIRFEEGRGVPRNLDHARALFSRAATTSGGQIAVWVPNGSGEGGHITFVDTGPVQPGLQEARERLRDLRERMERGER